MAVRAQHPPEQSLSRENQRPLLRSFLSGALTLTAMLAFVIALVASTVIAYGIFYRDQVYPGVETIGINIGGVTADEAQAALDDETSQYMGSDITFTYEDQSFTATPEQLGVTFDTERTVERAYEFGRTGNYWNDSRAWFDSLFFGHDVGVTPVIDSAALESYFQTIVGDVGAQPQVPVFQLSTDGQFEMAPSASGLGIDVQETASTLRSELSGLGDGPVEISTVEVEPAYTEEALDPLAERITGIISEDFVLERGDYQWVLDAERLDSLLDISTDSETGESELSVDTERLHRQISSISETAQSDGRNARVSWTGESFDVTPAADGWRIDVDESAEIVADAILAGDHYAELAITEESPSITTEVAEEAAEFGNEIATSPFELSWDEGDTELGGTVVAAAITFEHDSDAGTITPDISVEDLTMFMSSIIPETDVTPVDADLRYYDGEVVVESDEEDGWEMDREASAEAIAEAIEAGDTSAEIVVNEAEPEVTAAMADDIEIRDMISYGETYYAGAAENRAHNIELGTERANGALIPPGGTYSLTESIGGEISEDNGYRQGFGIEGATDGGVTTVPSIGGGICQVSTTVYHAAFWAGMPIVERNWHMYWLPSYGQDPSGITGLDATIATTAGLDFKFENTTDDWLAIVATADGNANRFEIWGTDPGWDVEVDGPNISNQVSASSETVTEESDLLPAGSRTQVETAQDGFDVEIIRRVYNGDGDEIDSETLNSSYQPASNRVLIGTGN